MEAITLSEVLVPVAAIGLVEIAKPFLRGQWREAASWYPVLALLAVGAFVLAVYPAPSLGASALKAVLYGMVASGGYAMALKRVLAQLGR